MTHYFITGGGWKEAREKLAELSEKHSVLKTPPLAKILNVESKELELSDEGCRLFEKWKKNKLEKI